jgi:ketosteroid isomerase-like protein
METDLRRRREALSAAFKARDADAILSFYDRSYTLHTTGQRTAGYEQTASTIHRLFRQHPSYTETLTIEKVEMRGDAAEFTVMRRRRLTGLLGGQRTERMRAVETWKRSEGVWMLVREQALLAPGEDQGGWNFPL